MRIRDVSLASQGAADNVLLAAAQGSTAGTAFALTGAAALLSPAREITFTSAGDLSAVTYTVVGLDRRGNLMTELIRGPNAATIRLRKVYSAVLSVTPDTTNAATMSVGIPARVVSNWFHTNTFMSTDAIPTARVQALSPSPGAAFGAGIVELTNENVMRISGEGAEPETTTIALGTAGAVAEPRAAYFRLVNTSVTATQQLRAAIATPSF